MHAAFDASRVRMLAEFQRRLGEPTTVIRDEHRDGLWTTARRAWLAYDPTSDWHIVLQDDMHACRGAMDTIRRVLADIPTRTIVSFFQPAVGEVRLQDEYIRPWREGRNLIETDYGDILWGGTIAVPTRYVAPMIEWIERFMPVEKFNVADDEKICFWAWHHRMRTLCYAPSLFEHVGWCSSVTANVPSERWKRGVLIADELEAN